MRRLYVPSRVLGVDPPYVAWSPAPPAACTPCYKTQDYAELPE